MSRGLSRNIPQVSYSKIQVFWREERFLSVKTEIWAKCGSRILMFKPASFSRGARWFLGYNGSWIIEEIPKGSLFPKPKFSVVNAVILKMFHVVLEYWSVNHACCPWNGVILRRPWLAELSLNIPCELFRNPSFLEKAAVFKFHAAPELLTLKFGQNVVPEYWCSNRALLPAERGDFWAIVGLWLSKKPQ